MIYHLKDVRQGYDIDADAVVVGSGAGGAVAALNLAQAGMRVVVLEAGPVVEPGEMTRDAPRFLAKHFWEGGLRLLGGTTQSPTMHARCLGGGTVVNSAIMLKLPGWVRQIWGRETGLSLFESEQLELAYDRVFERCRVAPTPMAVMGRRNLLVKAALDGAGIVGSPLPRAVADCAGSSDCLTGCAGGAKQSVDRSYLPEAERHHAEIYTASHVERVDTEGDRAVGVSGSIVALRGEKLAKFRVRAPIVVMAAGSLHTPVILQMSGITANKTVGSTFHAHIGGGLVGIMEQRVEPWVGATQGWGAMSEEIRGIKCEGLWASPSLLMTRWGSVGQPFMDQLDEVARATVIAVVYRGRVSGRVRARRNGSPSARLWVPDEEARTVYRGMKIAADALLRVGAEFVHAGIPGSVDRMCSESDTESLLSPRLKAKHLQMTCNHTFGSCPMGRDKDRTSVDENGRVRGVRGLYAMDASIFPSPSGVNPQATIMALSHILSRRLGERPV